nr:methionine adenosyltransferase [Deinococcota bacterium]
MKRLLTSESVTEGHPDKLADRISDGVLDAVLSEDPGARVAAETMVTTGLVLITGEISCRGYVDIQRIVRDSVREVGYTKSDYGIDADHCAVLVAIDEQSPDIAQGVTRSQEALSGDLFDQTGAGDQGMMFGYATKETPELMPLPIMLAHGLSRKLADLRTSGELAYLRPDGKAQVTVAYEGDRPVAVASAVVSAQHDEDVSQEQLEKDIREHLIEAVIPEAYLSGTRLYINPTGRFVIG